MLPAAGAAQIFQFHKGTIRTDAGFGFVPRFRFQFHKGTIRTSILFLHYLIVHHFNSIKVRLELILSNFQRVLLKFQFHKGTIRTLFPLALLRIKFNFNSIKVRLERYEF